MRKIKKSALCIFFAFLMVFISSYYGTVVFADSPIFDRYGRKHAAKYQKYETMDGIDVSYAQGDIDWARVKAAGIDFAFIRVGARGYGSQGNMFFDDSFVDNVKGAIDNGIEVGLYFFSQALTEQEAADEARATLKYMKPDKGTDLYTQLKGGLGKYMDKITLPIVMDYEYSSSDYGRFQWWSLSKAQATKNVEAFIKVIEEAGYDSCLYASASFLEDQVDGDYLSTKTKIWVAHYTDETDYEGDYEFWQYTCTGDIDGIDEYFVDLNVWYKKPESVVSDTYECVRTKYNGVTGWFVFKDGKICPEYKGFAKTEKGWWYCKNGRISFNTTDIIYGNVDGESGWWNVRNGRVIFEKTVARNENGWWYVDNGKVNFNYTGAARNENGWWRIVSGRVDFLCNTIIKNENGWWKCSGGRIDFAYTGLASNQYGWFYIINGMVDFSYTGLARNEYGWWYVKNGCVRFDYTGIAENQFGTWFISHGRIDFNYSGTFQDAEHLYYVEGGRITYVYY
ncbi:Lyzozyme M1 (1,4-beta-N-acetylmuramidase), GH25 family [Eubacterium ruminantium]|nr:Lyzozyme M1 (1,4-beta-N-acetylmuramidase), GH25 family [Eubacterium ruminantium]